MGSGNVMRSSALAEEAVSRGIECIFIGSLGGITWLSEYVMSVGFSSIFEDCESFLRNRLTDILVVDSYSLSIDDSFLAKDCWKRVITISDNVTPNYPADLLIHPGLDTDWLKGQGIPALAGPDYVMVRKSVRKVLKSLDIKKSGLNILVVGGGTDPYGFCQEIALVLDQFDQEFITHFFQMKKFLQAPEKILFFIN
jgi:spore coat polysaccharide biosynthesis predicted glycosyltransferase SpsG